MIEPLRENVHAPCSREQLLVELIDWCHSLTVLETEGDATLFPTATGCEAEQFAKSLGEQRASVREFLSSLQTRLEKAGDCLEHHIQGLEQELDTEREQNGRLSAARDALMASLTSIESRLAETQEQLAEHKKHPAEPAVYDETEEVEEGDFERRYQMALEDIRQEKEKNAKLQQQLANLRTTSDKSPQQHGWLDWETEKKRIVAALEADTSANDETKKTERLGIEEVLRMTDEVIASKDREIRDLKRQLEERTRALTGAPEAAIGPSGTQDIVDGDAAIQEERERLQTLQKEWREKLKQAEVDISLERAKIARERSDLDEQIRLVKDAMVESRGMPGAGSQTEQSPRGRWLAQLGLTAADREPSRHH